MADELGIQITVDEYTKQLRELQRIYFPEAELMPGLVCFILRTVALVIQSCNQHRLYLFNLTLLLMLFPFLRPPSGTISLRMFDHALTRPLSNRD